MSYLCYLCLFGSSLPPVVCRRAHVLFMLFVFVYNIKHIICDNNKNTQLLDPFS
jgi:hypothetical protein